MKLTVCVQPTTSLGMALVIFHLPEAVQGTFFANGTTITQSGIYTQLNKNKLQLN